MPLNKVKSQYPCFWFAKYENEVDNIIVPKCNICKKEFKLIDKYICNCGSEDLDLSNIYNLYENEIYEFDYNGTESIPFRFLPSKGMRVFGIANSVKNELYIIDLKNGSINLNGTIIYPSIYYKKDNLNICNILPKYGNGGDLIHFKTATAIPNKESFVKSFNLGYKCKINNLNIQVLISINTQDFTPSLYTTFNEN